MPIVSGKGAGSQNIAKAGVNRIATTSAIAPGANIQTQTLVVAGMPNLTFWIAQRSGVGSLEVKCQVALRWGNLGALEWVDLNSLTIIPAGGAPQIFTFQMVAQEIRFHIQNAAANPGNGTAQFILSATA